MSDTYWWLLYALAGAAVSWSAVKLMLHVMAKEGGMHLAMVDSIKAQPDRMALLLVVMWLFWPLVVLAAAGALGWVVGAALADGVEWLGRRVVRLLRQPFLKGRSG